MGRSLLSKSFLLIFSDNQEQKSDTQKNESICILLVTAIALFSIKSKAPSTLATLFHSVSQFITSGRAKWRARAH